jgi:1-phosphatidylinositol-3-phosphate 5-kinase
MGYLYDSNRPPQLNTDFETKNIEITTLPPEENENDTDTEEMDKNTLCWSPPEPKDEESDIAQYEDDDDEDDDDVDGGMKLGKASSLSSFGSSKLKEEKEKAMKEVMNGKFKGLISQLVKSFDVSCDNWVDIVTNLAWEAAAFVKPDNTDCKAMEPDGYVKIKCIATGSRTESRVFKGLVFKKHAAHKHMATNLANPKLLLIQGSLDLSSSGLSAFESMKQEKDTLNLIIDTIEKCHPNVVLVEKTVSRDIIDSIHAKGMTLVFDMKLHRLERVARCTASPILSVSMLTGQKLKHCDSFHIQKFVEEHSATADAAKKPTKTLMFLEGCPTRRGCTILLKGSNSDELKKVKSVIRLAVLMAYHLMLETSFLLDQKAMFSTILLYGSLTSSSPSPSQSSPLKIHDSDTDHHLEEESVVSNEIPISNGFHHDDEAEEESFLSYEPYNPAIFSGFSSLSASIKKAIIGNGLRSFLNGTETDVQPDYQLEDQTVDISSSPEATDNNSDVEIINGPSDEEKPEQKLASETQKSCDDVSTVSDSDSILVLLSRRNALRGTICEQNHFSHIKFYKNFDIPLGKFLRDNLLNQKLSCSTCGEPPEAHFYYYAHHNKQLTIQVKRLITKNPLPGETSGKLWMWSCCGKCKKQDGNCKSTKRVLISAAARGFSFGKFLELGLSSHSSFTRPSNCGHFLHKDFHYFFGLGPMVAMFKYSIVATYTVSLPPEKLDFRYPQSGDLIGEDFRNVRMKGDLMFLEVEKLLKEIGPKFAGSTLSFEGSPMKFSDVEEMLKSERDQFMANIENTVHNGNPDDAVYKHVHLNRVLWELLLESCIWDQRLNSLLSSEVKESKEVNNKVSENPRNGTESVEIPIEGETETEHNQNGSVLTSVQSGKSRSLLPTLSDMENWKRWIWIPFSEIRSEYLKELHKGYVPKFDTMSKQTRLTRFYNVIAEETSRLIIPLGEEDYIVRDYEEELSSVIACALALLKNTPIAAAEENNHIVESYIPNRTSSLTSSHWSSFGSFDAEGIESLANLSMDDSSSQFSNFNGSFLLDSLVSLRLPHPDAHMGMRKNPGKGKYYVACLYANEFEDLRKWSCSSESAYIASLSRCKFWDAKGGKSKSFFAKTRDDRFIIKEIKRIEYESFISFASDYFKYMKECYEIGNQTCLAKILGIYQVRVMKSGKEVRHDLMVMENLTFGRNVRRQYDLKGALHARLNSDDEDVLLDQNFVNDMNVSPLYLSRTAKRNLQRAVWNDTTFLNSINVMDYSLLVGVDSQRKELVCGIIDYLRQYTWDKQLENWVKSSLVVPKNQRPTVISPKEYKQRFRKFITTHFLSVPDNWCSRSSSPHAGTPKDDDNNSFHKKYQEENDGASS